METSCFISAALQSCCWKCASAVRQKRLGLWVKAEYPHPPRGWGGAGVRHAWLQLCVLCSCRWLLPAPAPAANSRRQSSSERPSSGSVVELTEDTFRDFVEAETVVLVLYHAPWCEHCERVRPEWDRAAVLLQEQGVRGRLGALDTSRPGHEDLALAQGVQQLPSMRLYVRGQLQARHVDVRQADAIVQLVRDAAAPAEQDLALQDHGPLLRLAGDQLKPFLSKKKHAFVLYYRPGESDDSDRVAESFERVSAALGSAAGPSSAALVAVDCAEQPVLCEAMLPPSPNLPVIKYYHFLDRAGAICDDQLQGADITRFLSARTAATEAGGGGGANGNGGAQGQGPEGAAHHWAGVQHKEAVVFLNDSSFDEVLRRSGRVLVFFYAPWCNYCSSIKQSYATAAKQLAESGLGGCMAAVDYSSNPLLEKRFRLEFLPAFKLFNKGVFEEDHNKLRSREEFVNLMDRTLRQK